MSINITEGENNKDRGRKRVRFLKETQQDGSRSFFRPRFEETTGDWKRFHKKDKRGDQRTNLKRQGITCYYCGKPNHYASKCRTRIRNGDRGYREYGSQRQENQTNCGPRGEESKGSPRGRVKGRFFRPFSANRDIPGPKQHIHTWKRWRKFC